MTTCESYWGISGPCKIVYDWWYRNRQKSVSFSGHISDRLSVVLVRAGPHKGVTECGAQWISAKAWLQGHGKYGHLSDRLRQKAPRRYLTFTFTFVVDLDLWSIFAFASRSTVHACIKYRTSAQALVRVWYVIRNLSFHGLVWLRTSLVLLLHTFLTSRHWRSCGQIFLPLDRARGESTFLAKVAMAQPTTITRMQLYTYIQYYYNSSLTRSLLVAALTQFCMHGGSIHDQPNEYTLHSYWTCKLTLSKNYC